MPSLTPLLNLTLGSLLAEAERPRADPARLAADLAHLQALLSVWSGRRPLQDYLEQDAGAYCAAAALEVARTASALWDDLSADPDGTAETLRRQREDPVRIVLADLLGIALRNLGELMFRKDYRALSPEIRHVRTVPLLMEDPRPARIGCYLSGERIRYEREARRPHKARFRDVWRRLG